MRRNFAQSITKGEWLEIMDLPEVKSTFGLGAVYNVDDFAGRIYGAKFPYEIHMSDDEGVTYTLVGNIAKGEVLMVDCLNGVFKALK